MSLHLSERNRPIIASFGLAERLLYLLSKDPARVFRGGYEDGASGQWNAGNALSTLRREFPDFDRLINGRRVLDYGCGDGYQSVAMAQAGAAEVLGVDLDDQRLKIARTLAEGISNVRFSKTLPEEVDVAISLNAFEHFPEPKNNLDELGRAVRLGGQILITFGPPWFAPHGSHMNFFTYCPWVNILFSERTVHRVRMLYRRDSPMSYGPPKMTIKMFEAVVRQSGLQIERLEYRTVKKLPVSGIPLVRELFINHVTCILRRVR